MCILCTLKVYGLILLYCVTGNLEKLPNGINQFVAQSDVLITVINLITSYSNIRKYGTLNRT